MAGAVMLMKAISLLVGLLVAQTTPTNLRVVSVDRGPIAAIQCPANAVRIAPSADVSQVVKTHPPGTSFCLETGTHHPAAPTYLEDGDSLTGEYGAIINGADVQQSFDQGGISVVSGWNCPNCANVTVRNLVIRGRDLISCVGAYGPGAGNWTIDHNDISGCRWGINVGKYWEGDAAHKIRVKGPTVTANRIHHNIWGGATGSDGSGAYGVQNTFDTEFVNNEVWANGGQPKFTAAIRSHVAQNFFHHNPVAVWFDGDNLDGIIENNLIEDSGAQGIFVEISASIIVRNNTVRRSGDTEIFISTSRDNEVYGNTVEGAWRGINLFVYCEVVGPPDFPYSGAIGFDLRNNNVHNNSVRVGPRPDPMASAFSWTGCSSSQIPPYVDNTKANRFSSNRYYVPTLTGSWWFWGVWKTWAQWQAIPQDATGSIVLQ